MVDASSSSVQGSLSPQNALKLAKNQLENARKTTDPDLAAILYNESRAALSRMNQPTLEAFLSSDCSQDPSLREEITFVLANLDEMLASLKQSSATQEVHAETGDSSSVHSTTTESMTFQNAVATDGAAALQHIFAENKRPPAIEFKLLGCGERLSGTPQLAYYLGLLQAWRSSPDDILDPSSRNWLQAVDKNEDEINRITALGMDVITTFIHEGVSDVKLTTEVLRLASVVDKNLYRHLFGQLSNEESFVLGSHQLGCLAQLIRSAPMEYLEAADMVKVLELLKNHLDDFIEESPDHFYELTLAVSSLIDAMADTTNIKGLETQQLYQYLHGYMNQVRRYGSHQLVFQGAYAYQALQHVSDDEAIWFAALQRTQKPFKLMDNTGAINIKEVVQKLQDGYEGLDGEPNREPQGETIEFLDERLQKDGSFECKMAWYPALRTADALLHGGQFSEFKKLALEAPCRLHPAFQWGLCLLLGDLAADLEWDTKTRLDAVAFLQDIHQNDALWGQQPSVQRLIIFTLRKLASLPESVKQAADAFLREDDTPIDLGMHQANRGIGLKFSPLNHVFPSLATPSLLDRVQDTPGVESIFCQLRKQRLAEHQGSVYVNPQAKGTLKPYDLARFSLMDRTQEFLKGDRRVLLLLGGAGSGKSTFSRVLERDLWSSYEGIESPIPIYINLSTIDQPTNDTIGRHIRRLGFNEDQIKELKIYRKFILICDEYDQILQPDNLYTTNKLNQPGGWNVKLIVCCRSEYLASCSLNYFQPTDQNCQEQPELFQQAAIAPFVMDQVQDHIKQYVSLHKPPWKTDDYLQVFERDLCLQDISRNPLLLSLTLEILPRLAHSPQELSVESFNKATIYDQIVARWFERSKERFESTTAGDGPERLAFGDFVQSGINYLKRLAGAIYKNQGGLPVVQYSHLYSRFKQDGAWKEDFFGQDEGVRILREVSPLKCSGNKFQFIHPSFLEYGLALSIFDPQEVQRASASRPVLARRGSTDSVMSFESDGTDEETTTTVDQGPEHDSPLSWRSFVNDQSVLQFLEDRVKQEPFFKQQLTAFIDLSKTLKKWRTAAVNAITILVGAEVSFKGADLRGIQVPGANLSHGMFESAQLQGADLRKTNLRNTWLYKADLSQAQMKGVQFGESLCILENSCVYCCAYSPDGTIFAVGGSSGKINLYATSNWGHIRTLAGHDSDVNDIAFSAKGVIVSGSSDKTVRLWHVETGECFTTLTGHNDEVSGVAFSPQGDHVVSSSFDQTVRLWSLDSGTCQRILNGQEQGVWSVAFSPSGHQIASGGDNKTLVLWDVESGTLHSTLSGHDGTVHSIVYSPQGQLIASGSDDDTVRLWDVESGTCQSILRGHFGSIRSVAFSPLSNLIATGSRDNTIELWDVESGVCQDILSGHDGVIRSVLFSLKGDQIVSGSEDKSVRLWSIGARACRHTICNNDGLVGGASISPASNLIAAGGPVKSVAISLTGRLIAAGRNDGIVRLWDIGTRVCVKTLIGHSKQVTSIAFSPGDSQIVSGSDDETARLWNMKTGMCQHVLQGHSKEVTSVTFSPRGDLVASASVDGTIRVWATETGLCSGVLVGHCCRIMSVAFSPTGDRIVSCSEYRTVRLWSVKTKGLICSFDGHTHPILRVGFSSEGDVIASGSSDGEVRLWDVKDGSCNHISKGQGKSVTSVVFSPKGDQVASSCGDNSVQLRSVPSSQSQGVVHLQGQVTCLAWGTNSGLDCLVTGEKDGTVQIWQVKENGGQCEPLPHWIPTFRLSLTDASMDGVQGLRDCDKWLLKQHGALNVPN
ncbi:hypothetical protein BGX31_005319 [Mortierella sp. GBA43]|nr:hypothetical protein BGX31_005319 [Mortierella sp. GBA43]